MGNRIVGMRGNRRLERGARFFVLPALRPDHRQIVVRLRQLRKIFGQGQEGGHSIVGLVLVGLDDAAQEARLWILGVCRERGIDLDPRRRILSLLDHAGRLRQIGRETRSRGGGGPSVAEGGGGGACASATPPSINSVMTMMGRLSTWNETPTAVVNSSRACCLRRSMR